MLSLSNKRWCPAQPSAEVVSLIERQLQVPTAVAELLANRGVTTQAGAKELLDADLSTLHDPFLMTDMRAAVDRVVEALDSKQAITVFCDYDVDGVTSAAFLNHFFRDLACSVQAYLPERQSEGYGLNSDAVRKIRHSGASLMITADCGITGVAEVALANELGLDVIITDHHQVGADGLPPAVAVINPHRDDCNYPYRFLAGVGLAFKLALGVRSALHAAGWPKDRLPNMKRHLDLFALGTIADVAPLTGENHVLARHGLEVLSRTAKPGLVALKEAAGVDSKVDARTVGFGLGPRLNAAGRLGRADNGLHLLTSSNLPQARNIAQELEDTNTERREIQAKTVAVAESLLEKAFDPQNDRVIVLASPAFHAGVIGIAASRLVDKYYRPTVLIALENGQGKGSGRSITKFNLFRAFTDCGRHLVQFGGHAYAAGLTIAEDQIQAFRQSMNDLGHRYLSEADLISEVRIDTELNLAAINLSLYGAISQLEPFGAENPEPCFVSHGVKLLDFRLIGKDKTHIRFCAQQRDGQIEGVGFGFGPQLESVDVTTACFDIAYQLNLNTWNGREKLEIKLVDIRLTE